MEEKYYRVTFITYFNDIGTGNTLDSHRVVYCPINELGTVLSSCLFDATTVIIYEVPKGALSYIDQEKK